MQHGPRKRKAASIESVVDPVESARAAGLRYVTDASPGFKRVNCRGGFRFVDLEGRPVRDPDTLKRISSLVIPPAWTRVWICPVANGHLQATGRDARGRKQSRYHPRWRETRDETKYERMLLFGDALPKIRAQGGEGSRAAWTATSQSPGDDRAADGDDLHPRGQRRIRTREP